MVVDIDATACACLRACTTPPELADIITMDVDGTRGAGDDLYSVDVRTCVRVFVLASVRGGARKLPACLSAWTSR